MKKINIYEKTKQSFMVNWSNVGNICNLTEQFKFVNQIEKG